jgi:hypothetical protein
VTVVDRCPLRQAKVPSERMAKWVLHWDQQVYKALEAGYQMGLEVSQHHP